MPTPLHASRRRPWQAPARLPPLLALLVALSPGSPGRGGCRGAGAWNSFATSSQIYSFQEFYTDAQYGPDFGYYSTGAILHADGPADNGVEGGGGASQEWFNSYTTLPMSLSPDFADALCDRLVTMWQAMGRPERVIVAEFGGGTGMLARDILRRARNSHGAFYAALARYVIAERSAALRGAQQHTAAEFVAAGKLQVVSADAREASRVRPTLQAALAEGGDEGETSTVGFVLSNELLDEFDPVRLRLMWAAGDPPSAERCSECDVYREAHVVHYVDAAAFHALMQPGIETPMFAEEALWEGQSLHCGLLSTPALRQAALAVTEEMEPFERESCAPMLVCCLPFLLAANQALMFNAVALDPEQLKIRREREPGGKPIGELANLYRHHLRRLNGTVPLSKQRYRELRRLASARGSDVERALLVGGAPSVLPGRMYSEEVFLSLHPRRCAELRGWMQRHAARLAVAARLRNGVAWIYDGDAGYGRTSMHLKLVVRPGEAAFVEQAAKLLDEGFLVTLDYGADADALVWQALIRPNYEGIHIMDARNELAKECTDVSYLECPGLQDLTTSVDFTEVAEAGRQLGDWEVLAYGPIFLLELAFHGTALDLAAPGEPMRLGHLVERAFGVRTAGLSAWYQKPEQDPWASFKLLVQHRGARGGQWTLGALSNEWPLSAMPRLVSSPSPCWRRDITKPPLASFIATATHRTWESELATLAPSSEDAWKRAAAELHERTATNSSTKVGIAESPRAHDLLLQHFQAVLTDSDAPLVHLLDEQHTSQRQAYADLHLALLLVDYWHLVQEAEDTGRSSDDGVESSLAEVRSIATSRRLPEIYGEAAFQRVFNDVGAVIRNASLPGPDFDPPYACLAGRALASRAAVL
eukprot:TRINITY_DN22221_c0_g2_i1.p1 TRINITY_DN22221_c0_g2~~TRINITY_DN22221_c0_g2_i1.p1  ORF type:complete len:875 (-),score=181.55 TRINITY_DN22221_c0_g2_i1:43-2667(-)